ncbi:MAG: ATP-binding protein [Acidimicrobiales bacterium]
MSDRAEVGRAEVGRVLGTEDSTPLEFWVALAPDQVVQLDEVLVCDRAVPGLAAPVSLSGVVSQVRARHEGARFDSDVFSADDGLPLEVSEAVQVLVTRVDPEVYVPPLPGTGVRRAEGAERDRALSVDEMAAPMPAGLSRDGQLVMLNLEFLDGTRGAHVNISGVSGVATKTTYATFLLHSLFTSGRLGADAHNAKAIVFNVKGEDLLYLDKANALLTDAERARYDQLGLPAQPFASTAFWAPPRPDGTSSPDVEGRDTGITSFFWSLEAFCAEGLLPFLFADSEDDRQQYSIVVHNVAHRLEQEAVPAGDGAVRLPGTDAALRTFGELCEAIRANLELDPDHWAGRAIGPGTVNAFIRRLFAAIPHLKRLIRADIPAGAGHRIDTGQAQVTVVDLHTLADRAKRFVVGVTVRRAFEEKERRGRRPLLFLVLDELNKYAPREGHSPIKEILLDVAERGRSLGVILIGAQQTASEVERRIIANSAIRVVGRLDAAEAGRDEYGFLPTLQRQRATILKPGTMILAQPQLPVPLVIQFPFPAWATKKDETIPEPHGVGAALLRRLR